MRDEMVGRVLEEEEEDEDDPVEAAHLMIRHMDKKRAALKLKPLIYEQPFKQEE